MDYAALDQTRPGLSGGAVRESTAAAADAVTVCLPHLLGQLPRALVAWLGSAGRRGRVQLGHQPAHLLHLPTQQRTTDWANQTAASLLAHPARPGPVCVAWKSLATAVTPRSSRPKIESDPTRSGRGSRKALRPQMALGVWVRSE